MKRGLSLVIALVLCFTICACGNRTNSNGIENTQPQQQTQATVNESHVKDQLDSIAKNLRNAHGYYDKASSILLENWSAAANYLGYFYDEIEYQKSKEYLSSYLTSKCDEKYKYQKAGLEILNETLSILKEISPTENTKAYYDALKAYYTALKEYKNLITVWPEGYSKLTYSQAITDAKSIAERAYIELDFYK